MKIVHFFNINNNAYIIAKFLRRKGIEAEIIVDRGDFLHGMPSWEEEIDDDMSKGDRLNLEEQTKWTPPDWVKYVEKGKYLGRYGLYSFKLIQMLREYDILHAYTMAPIWAQFVGRPYVANSTGSDLDILAFENNHKGWLMRRGFRKAETVWINTHQLNNAEKLGLSDVHFWRIPMDVEKFSHFSKREVLTLKDKYNYDLIFFSQTRHYWKVKGNDKMLRAFARFVKKEKNAILLTIDWGYDVDRSKLLVKDLGIEKKVVFLPFMSKRRLIEYYNASDIILEQFNVGSLGTGALEAMSCGKPMVAYFNEEDYKKCYSELPPILNAKTEQQIYEHLLEIGSDKLQISEIGNRTRKWIEKYHHWDGVIDRYIELYESML